MVMSPAGLGPENDCAGPAALSRGKSPRYPLDRRLGGSQSRSGRCGEEKILHPTGLELRPLDRPARSESLYRLSYPG
jgi:hypothetical protein